jgi:hypothetical protein
MNSLRPARTLLTSLLFNALLLAALLFAVLFLIATASAQVPDTLKHSIPPAFKGVETDTNLGFAVAYDAGMTVAGARSNSGSGVVTVFGPKGEVLYLLKCPDANHRDFGRSVAISGLRVAVWASYLKSGSPSYYAGSTFIYNLGGPTPTVPVATLDNPNLLSGGNNIGVVAISGNRVIVGVPFDVTDTSYQSGSAYFFDLAGANPNVPVFEITNPTPATNDWFGISVAISGTRVVIGAVQDDTGAADAGSAYVYDLTGASPTLPIASLHDPSPHDADRFGSSVAISGTRVVVGAPNKSIAGINPGSAYAYDLASATPTVPMITFNKPDPAADDLFGTSVAISGTRVIVGAQGDDTLANNAGSAYAYDLSGATPDIPTRTLSDPGATVGDAFGSAVAISGTQAVVGAPFDSTVASKAGIAYLYNLANPAPLTPNQVLRDSSRQSVSDAFGTSVAISGTRMVVGTRYAGGVAVYDLAGTAPTAPVAKIFNPGPATSIFFGQSVAVSGTLVAVGSPYAVDGAGLSAPGTVYLFDLAGTTPGTPVLTLQRPGATGDDYFGGAVAMSGTLLLVGAYSEDTGGVNAGSAYVYDLASATPAVPMFTLHNPNPSFFKEFGSSVSISGTRLVVGASYDTSAVARGSAYVYDLASATPTVPVASLGSPSASTSDHFGYAVAIDGTRVAVGAFAFGIVYVYDVAGSDPLRPALTLFDPHTGNGQFGYAVALSGDRLAVGARADNTGATQAGCVHVYDLAGSTPTSPIATLNNPSPDLQDQFGSAVAIAGTTVAAGAPFDSAVAYRKGYAYVFTPANDDFDGNGLLDLWEYAHFGNATGHSATGDNEQDGVINLLEEAFDTDPLHSNAPAIPVVVNNGGYLTMTITKRAGVTYQVQSAATPDGAAFSAAATTVLVNNATTLRVRDNVPIGTPPGRFLRVKVTAAP